MNETSVLLTNIPDISSLPTHIFDFVHMARPIIRNLYFLLYLKVHVFAEMLLRQYMMHFWFFLGYSICLLKI
jgi:hypothetical protein